jgi:hypothetical protein
MPIRMVDDNNDNTTNENEGTSGGGGNRSGGNLLQFLPMIIGLLIKKPSLLLIVLAGAAFFYFKGGGCNMSSISNTVQQFTTGGNLNRDTFAKAAVYEGLDETKTNLSRIYFFAKICTRQIKSRSTR